MVKLTTKKSSSYLELECLESFIVSVDVPGLEARLLDSDDEDCQDVVLKSIADHVDGDSLSHLGAEEELWKPRAPQWGAISYPIPGRCTSSP